MRNDYKLMHILNKHTNVTPEKRRSVLVDLINCFNGMKNNIICHIVIF